MPAIRPEVMRLLALGRMPDEDAEEEDIDEWADKLKAIQAPLSNDEAEALAQYFPPDMGYGVGFSMLHLLETAPGWTDALAATINDEEWRVRARNRIANAKKGG